MTKVQIRECVKYKRKLQDSAYIESASKHITNKVIGLKVFKEAATVYLYAAFKNEVQTKYLHEIAKSQGKKIAYPKIKLGTGKMDFYNVDNLEELEASTFKLMQIYEPNPLLHTEAIPVSKDIIIVPGVAFDIQGGRVGYGGGFYDRYLEKYACLYKVGVGMDFQLFDQVSTEDFDVTLDCILSEQQGYLPFE